MVVCSEAAIFHEMIVGKRRIPAIIRRKIIALCSLSKVQAKSAEHGAENDYSYHEMRSD